MADDYDYGDDEIDADEVDEVDEVDEDTEAPAKWPPERPPMNVARVLLALAGIVLGLVLVYVGLTIAARG